jgi:hypothetical protein
MAGSDRMKTGNPAVKLTYDDFVQFPDDGKRHELIDGVHYVTPSPNMNHQQVLGMLHGLIWTHLQMQPVGKVFLSRLTWCSQCSTSSSRTFCISPTSARRKH